MAYWDARNQFLRTGVGVKETDYPLRLFQSAGEGLLQAVAKSEEFSSAYDPLLILAERLKSAEPATAFNILNRLDAANSSRSDARLLRERLFPANH